MKSNFVGVKTISDGIEALDLKAIADKTFNLDAMSWVMGSLSWVMGSFVTANEELIKILRRRETSPLDPCTPPNQTTVPSNPKYSGGSIESADSWTSSDSRAEHFTHQFVYQFVNASLQAIQRQLGKISWLIESCNELISRFGPHIPTT
jgi:hypothetical protein